MQVRLNRPPAPGGLSSGKLLSAVAAELPHRAKKSTIDALTGSRFIAAMIVVLFHFGTRLALPWPLSKLTDGPAAVAYFFVLSGFILAYNYADWFDRAVRWCDWKRFLRARIARIYPMHLCALLLGTALTLWGFKYSPNIAESIYGTPSAALLWKTWIANLLLVMVYIPEMVYIMPWNPPAWSIAAELFFYFLFPFIVRGLGRLRSRGGLVIAVATIYVGEMVLVNVGARALGCIGSAVPWSHYALRLYGMPPFRLGEFAIGCCLGLLYLRRPACKTLPETQKGVFLRTIGLFAGMAVVAAILLIPPTEGHWAQWERIYRGFPLFTLPMALIVYCLASGRTLLSPILTSRPLVALGDASYGLYMVHWIVLMVWNYTNLPVPTTWMLVLSLIPLSLAGHAWIERPARRIILGAPRPSRVPEPNR